MKPWYAELRENRRVYFTASRSVRRVMERRALYYAALCIHQGWRASYRMMMDGRMPSLPCAKVFIRRREHLRPSQWIGVNPKYSAKARFAKVLCGAWSNEDSCRDVLMERYFPVAKVSAIGQWALWLHRAYPRNWPNDHGQVIREHMEVLRWVRTGEKPQEQTILELTHTHQKRA